MAYTYNDNGNWIVGSKQHTAEWIAIIKDEEGTIVSPQGLVDFLAKQEADEAVAKQIADAKQYLASTDWYYARKLEEGTEVPADVVAKRIELRALINSIEG